MLKEEWRTHSRLFGSYGFAAFPLLVILMTGVSYPVLALSGFSLEEILLGVHALVFFFGLNIGTIGFIGRDALKNLLGEQNLLIFSSRTLPLSQKRILATFLVKDFIYYAVLFIVPIIIGVIPAFFYFNAAFQQLLLVWVTATGAFMLGVALSFLFVILYLRSPVAALLSVVLGVITLIAYADLIFLATPIAFFLIPAPQTFITGFLPILALIMLGLALFSTTEHQSMHTKNSQYAPLRKRLSVMGSPVMVKSLLDTSRSSGSLFKILFSQGIVFAVFAYFLLSIPFFSVLSSRAVIALAIILGLGSITTYSWLNRFDRGENYLKLPLSLEHVFNGKLSAFFFLTIPAGYAYLVAAGVLFGFSNIVMAFIMYPLLCMYMFGATAFLTGLDPDRLMFDAKRFALFTVLSGAIIIPLFLSLLVIQNQVAVTVFLLTLSALAAGAGHTLYEHAVHRWQHRLMQ